MTLLKTRTRIVQLAIAMVALAAMTLGGSFAAHAGNAPTVIFNPATGAAHYDADGDGLVGLTECVTGANPLVPAGNGAWGGILTCPDGSLMSVLVHPGFDIAIVAPGGSPVIVALT